MRYELDEIGETVSYSEIEGKIKELVSREVNVSKEDVVIPPAGCVQQEDFVACNFIIDKKPGAVIITLHDMPNEKKVYLRHGIIFYKCDKKE